MSTGKTLGPYPAPLITLGVRAEASATTAATATADCPTVPPVTIIPPSVTPGPCTCVTGSYDVMYVRKCHSSLNILLIYSSSTDTVTTTKSGVSTTTTTPVSTVTVTETWILPTPTAYNGMFSFN
jgi:hypothetical protein